MDCALGISLRLLETHIYTSSGTTKQAPLITSNPHHAAPYKKVSTFTMTARPTELSNHTIIASSLQRLNPPPLHIRRISYNFLPWLCTMLDALFNRKKHITSSVYDCTVEDVVVAIVTHIRHLVCGTVTLWRHRLCLQTPIKRNHRCILHQYIFHNY